MNKKYMYISKNNNKFSINHSHAGKNNERWKKYLRPDKERISYSFIPVTPCMNRPREERPDGKEICKSFFERKKKKEKGWKDYPNPSATDWLAYANFLMTDQPEYTAETCDVMLRRVGIKMILINSNVRSPFFVAPRRLRLIYQYYTSRGKKTRDKSFICGSNRFESADEKLFESRDTQRSTFAIRTFINEN